MRRRHLGSVSPSYVVSDLRCEVVENCVLLGCYAASSGNFLPTFRDILSVPSSRVKNPKTKPGTMVWGLHREECGQKNPKRKLGTLVGGLCREEFYYISSSSFSHFAH